MSRGFAASRLRRSASFSSLTGVTVAVFDEMLLRLRGPWQAAQDRKSKSGRPWEAGGLEDRLLVMPIYDRCYVTQEFIGFFSDVGRSAICRTI